MRVLATCTFIALLILSGCSNFMQGVDPEQDRGKLPDCTQSYAPVYVDVVASGTLVSSAIEIPDLDASFITALIVIAGFYTASALSGASTYRSCRRARAEWYVARALAGRISPADLPEQSGALRKTVWCYGLGDETRCFVRRATCSLQRARILDATTRCRERPLRREQVLPP